MKRGGPEHPKTEMLMDALSLKRYQAVGVLESLWHFAAVYARRGDVGRFSAAALARRLEWDGDPEALVRGLEESGFLDRCDCHGLRIHDWPEHADNGIKAWAKGTTSKPGPGFLECYDPQPPPEPPPEVGLRGKGRTPDLATATAKGKGQRATATAEDPLRLRCGRLIRQIVDRDGGHLDERQVWIDAVPEKRREWRGNLNIQTADEDVLLLAERNLRARLPPEPERVTDEQARMYWVMNLRPKGLKRGPTDEEVEAARRELEEARREREPEPRARTVPL